MEGTLPIVHLKQHLLSAGLAQDSDLQAIEREVTELTEEAHTRAVASPYPEAESATTHVYSDAPATPTTITTGRPARELSYMKATLESA